MKKKKTTPIQNRTGKEEQASKSILWKRHGLDDVYFQRETIVNFLSIVEGVSVGALLTQFFPMVEQIRDSRWQLLLFFAASILVLINIWIQNSWGTLVLKWTISIPLLIPQFLILFSSCIMCLLVTYPPGWMASAGVFILLFLLSQLLWMKRGGWESFSNQRVKGIKTSLMIYLFWMVLAFLSSAHLYFQPSKGNETIWGVVAFLSSIAALVLQHQGMEQERKDFGIP